MLRRRRKQSKPLQSGCLTATPQGFGTEAGVVQMADIGRRFAEHARFSEFDMLGKSLTPVLDVLMHHQKDIEADMIVMGAYGHSRLREAILGGATRNMLEQAYVPVLMAH